MNEADTCRKLVRPKLESSGWDGDKHFYNEQTSFTDGRIIVPGGKPRRLKKKFSDFLLRYTRDITLAVVEAKSDKRPAGDGLQQAKDYATILGLKFAYATNGKDIIESDFFTGQEKEVERFPTPDELWFRYQQGQGLSGSIANARLVPDFYNPKKIARYYQRIAIDRSIEAILKGQKRCLLTMATGTGKTTVAFQICWKLWSAGWNTSGDPARKPRILFLTDRNVLVDDPKDKDFAPFGEARMKIEGEAIKSREMYFAIYQAIAKDERRPGLYLEYARDFFDLIIIDECHRGSSRDESNWREILEYFAPAYQLGMTATPLREDNRDTYNYFGTPLYTYSLKQGIEDSFLSPYRVQLVELNEDKVSVSLGEKYPQIGIQGFGGGLFERGNTNASDTTYKSVNRLFTGALVLSQVKGWEGAIAVCSNQFFGLFSSPEYRTFHCREGKILAEYLAAITPTPWFWKQLHNLTREVGARQNESDQRCFWRWRFLCRP